MNKLLPMILSIAALGGLVWLGFFLWQQSKKSAAPIVAPPQPVVVGRTSDTAQIISAGASAIDSIQNLF
jgi:hypothetical protein